MTDSAQSRGVPPENHVPGAPLESILCTEELHRRLSHPPNYEKENCALVKLVSGLADSPGIVFQTLAETILDITQCDSAVVSLLTTDGKTPDVRGRRFYWPAIAGMWSSHMGGGTPRDFGPCGDVLDSNRPLLFRHFERRYSYLQPVVPAAEQCLLVPFYVAGEAVGTIWAIMHSDRRTFDAEDERVLAFLAKFASSAYQALMNIEQKRAESRLRRSEAFLAEGERIGQIGSYSWRVANDEITWSEQLYHIFELEADVPVTAELIRSRVHPEDLSLYEKMLEGARSGGHDFEWQYRLRMPDHSIKYLHAVARASRDPEGQLEYIATIQDVTGRRLSQEARDKARSELADVANVMSLGTLAASIAHEVNQPLSGIITNANTCLRMLAADPPNVEGARETTQRTLRDGNRASEVITRLRALFSKRDAATEAVNLNEAALEVIDLSLADLQKNEVVLRPELADDLPLVTGDRVQLQQVILNLLRNGSDAMCAVEDRPRQLVIRTEQEEGGRVRLTVQDAGMGIESDGDARLFEPFYTTKSGGMGIGLSVSRSIIERHHGRLWATRNDGRGAAFSFSIPRAPEGLGRADGIRNTQANRRDAGGVI